MMTHISMAQHQHINYTLSIRLSSRLLLTTHPRPLQSLMEMFGVGEMRYGLRNAHSEFSHSTNEKAFGQFFCSNMDS